MQEGKIVRLMDKGYGFIAREGESKDLFFHLRDLKNVRFDELREGDAVRFNVKDGEKGPNAVEIERV